MASMNCMTLVHQPQRWFMPSLGARSTNLIIQVDYDIGFKGPSHQDKQGISMSCKIKANSVSYRT